MTASEKDLKEFLKGSVLIYFLNLEIKNLDSQEGNNFEQQKKLWGKALEYINYARVGLNLDEKEIQFKQEKESFNSRIVENLNFSFEKEKVGINPRTPLKGGLEQYISNRKISAQDKKDFKDFISLLKNTCKLEAKYTQSVISFRKRYQDLYFM